MNERPRVYTDILRDHLKRHGQMALVSGPRQVGKTTTCRTVGDHYLNWDNTDDRRQLLRGPGALATTLGLERLRAEAPVTVLDELHKHTSLSMPTLRRKSACPWTPSSAGWTC